MCDTVVALGNSTKDGSVLFGKNSDREPNEAHNVVYSKSAKHDPNSKVNCTYISIPQVEETYEVLLLKPFWMFGCEMGANEFGVTIGNEAVWSKEPYRDTGLLGMDLMRLALERGENAESALNIIVDLLEKYGQGGACGYTDKTLKYHNSFIIADPNDAWVLETADKYWIAEKVEDIRTISNTLTIGNKYDKIHPELIPHAIDEGYCKSEEDFHFAECFIPRFNIKQIGAKGSTRIECTMNKLRKNKGKITPEIIMATLRDHNIKPSKQDEWDPSQGSMKSPCMHYTSFITPSQSVGSHVAHLKKDLQIHWVTGTSAPCTSIFKPIFLPKSGLTAHFPRAEGEYDEETLWWRHEKLHRLVLMDYQKRLNIYRDERNQMEAEFLKKMRKLIEKISSPLSQDNIDQLTSLTNESLKNSMQKTLEWIDSIKNLPRDSKPGYFYRRRWNKLNSHDNLTL
ncbi:MAG: peptidase U34 [Candidatus Lokiarchaeota archaeon]|nr:peptidase U34 [Candidatus Lokiarchaeota archaeon]